VLYPFFYHTRSRDIIIVHINPLEHEELPQNPVSIQDRINEITFNGSLLKELRAVSFVTKLLEEGWLKDEYRSHFKHILVHSLRADEALRGLNVSSKFNCSWKFLISLRDRGREATATWLERHYADLGRRSSIDLHAEYLGIPQHLLNTNTVVAQPPASMEHHSGTQVEHACGARVIASRSPQILEG